MKFIAAVGITIFWGFIMGANAAPQAIYAFSSQEQQHRFEQLTQELRCLVCQNESLADSNAPLAQDLRLEIYQQIQQNQDVETIKKYLLARYGQFILFKPRLNQLTYVLWLAPFVLLLVAFSILLGLVYARRNTTLTSLSAQEQQRLKDLGL